MRFDGVPPNWQPPCRAERTILEALSRGNRAFVIPERKKETASIDDLKVFILLTAMAKDGTLAADFTDTETSFTITDLGRAVLDMPLYS